MPSAELGRRVMARVRRPNGGAPAGTNPLCSSIVSGVCSSYYERTWWAGQQILAEWRTADGTPNPTNSGTVGYVHAPGVTSIDAPVAVITTGGASAGTRVITADWRGMGESSLFPNGAPADNTLYGGTAITVAWPSGRGAYFTPYLGQPSGSSVEHTWLGSLVEHGAGSAGLLYRRNRYYDPQTGRFTQQDPIGIAGGVNVYGFAGGDPVSYRDPFGLAPVDDIYYNENGTEIRRVATDEPDQHFLEYQGLTYALDYGLVESSSPYIVHTDSRGFDWMATALANQAAPHSNRLVVGALSLPGMSLDFKRNIPDRSLFNAGSGLMTHKHALGNAAWGYYMKSMGFGVGEALKGARLQGTTRGGEDTLDQQMIRRGFAIP